MRKNTLISLCLSMIVVGVLIATNGFAQSTIKIKSRNPNLKQKDLEVAVNPRLYFNRLNLFHDDYSPDPLSTSWANMDMHFSALTFRKTTPYGLMYGFGIDLGTRTHNLRVKYDDLSHFSDFPILKEISYDTSIRIVGYTYNARMFIGYKRYVKHLLVGVELGLSKQFFFNGWTEEFDLRNDAFNQSVISRRSFAHMDVYFGNGGDRFNGPLMWDAFLGVYGVEHKWLPHNCNIGLTSTLLFGYPLRPYKEHGRQSGIVTVHNFYKNASNHRKEPSENPVLGDAYLPVDFSLGIKVGIGLYRF